jgi:HKD family nuclease
MALFQSSIGPVSHAPGFGSSGGEWNFPSVAWAAASHAWPSGCTVATHLIDERRVPSLVTRSVDHARMREWKSARAVVAEGTIGVMATSAGSDRVNKNTQLIVDNYEQQLKELAESALEVKVLIAFLTEGGLAWLPAAKYTAATFIVGIDLGITTLGSLRRLKDGGADVRVFREPGAMFHPKALYFRTPTEEWLLVGSNNLTLKGISSNHEVAILLRLSEDSTETFDDFHAHFDSLLNHPHCGQPTEQFFQTYVPTGIRTKLFEAVSMTVTEGLAQVPRRANLPKEKLRTLGAFIDLLAVEFPQLTRRQGNKIGDDPLKSLNDSEFRPLFEEIVANVSDGRLKAESQLNIGGNWYNVPKIFVTHPTKEPWENTNSRGRLLLQVHLSEDYSTAMFSLVIQYNIEKALASGEMPAPVKQRYESVLEHMQRYHPGVSLLGAAFRHWSHEDTSLWSQPIRSFKYQVGSLPSDESMYRDLQELVADLDRAALVR